MKKTYIFLVQELQYKIKHVKNVVVDKHVIFKFQVESSNISFIF